MPKYDSLNVQVFPESTDPQLFELYNQSNEKNTFALLKSKGFSELFLDTMDLVERFGLNPYIAINFIDSNISLKSLDSLFVGPGVLVSQGLQIETDLTNYVENVQVYAAAHRHLGLRAKSFCKDIRQSYPRKEFGNFFPLASSLSRFYYSYIC